MTTTFPSTDPSSARSAHPTPARSADPHAAGPADPRPAFLRAVDTACAAVAAVRPDQLDGPTPCSEYDVGTLIGHLISVLRRVAAVGRGAPPSSVPQVTVGIPDDGWGAAARAAADEVRAVWADDSLLTRELMLPFGTHPGAVAMGTYTGELTTHTWDLAVATGQSPAWDDAVLGQALAVSRRVLGATGRGPGIPFEPEVPVPDGAPLVEQLVAWQGRNPSWRPPS